MRRPGRTRSLPLELLRLVVQYSIDDMVASKDGSTVRVLMHTSSIIRYEVSRAFEPVKLHERSTAQKAGRQELCVPYDLFTYIWRALQYALSDVSIQPHGKKEDKVNRPRCSDLLVALDGSRGDAVKCSVIIASDTVLLSDGRITEEPQRRESSWATSGEAPESLVSHAEYRLERSLQKLGPLLRSASPFERARSGSLGMPALPASIFVTITLRSLGSTWETSPCRTWQFDTFASGI